MCFLSTPNFRLLRGGSPNSPVRTWSLEGTKGTFELVVLNNLCDKDGEQSLLWKPFLKQVISDWNENGTLKIIEKKTKTNGKEKIMSCNNSPLFYNGFVNIVNGSWSDEKWEGLARWRSRGGHIQSVVVLMNEFYLFNEKKPSNSNDLNRRQTLCHEIGHALGLNHQDENHFNRNTGSCMDYSSKIEGGPFYGPSNVAPNAIDFQSLKEAYTSNDKNRRSTNNVKNRRRKKLRKRKRLRFKDEGRKRRKDNSRALVHFDSQYFGSIVNEVKCGDTIHRTYEYIDDDGILFTTMARVRERV